MDGKLLGYKRFKSKAGKECCVAVVVSEYSQRDMERGCVGSGANEIFLPEEQYNYLTAKDIGKPVKLTYEISNGRAYLQEFAVQ